MQSLNELAETLEYCWSATVKLPNGFTVEIWYTAWPQHKNRGSEIISIYSDYPRFAIRK